MHAGSAPPLILISSGFMLGFWRAFLVLYPCHVLGGVLCFLMSRSCCMRTAHVVVASRPTLSALQSALHTGGLKLIVLVRFAPGVQGFIASVAFAGLNVSLRDFTLSSIVSNTAHCAVPVFVGSVAGDLSAALGGQGTSGARGVAKHAQLASTLVGVAAAVLAVGMISVFLKRELRRSSVTVNESE